MICPECGGVRQHYQRQPCPTCGDAFSIADEQAMRLFDARNGLMDRVDRGLRGLAEKAGEAATEANLSQEEA